MCVGLALLLSSCHSKYAGLSVMLCRKPAWNADKTAVAFMVTKKISHRPVGLAKFPDGGTSLVKFADVDLYYLNKNQMELIKIADYQILSKWINVWHDSYSAQIVVDDSLVYYKWTGSSYRIKKALNGTDSLEAAKVLKMLEKPYLFNINTRRTVEIDTATFFSIYRTLSKRNKIYYNDDYREVTDEIRKLSLSQLEIPFNRFISLSPQKAIRYIAYNEGGYWIQREIYNRVLPNLSRQKLLKLLKLMDARLKRLEKHADYSYKSKTTMEHYRDYYNVTYPKIKAYLARLNQE